MLSLSYCKWLLFRTGEVGENPLSASSVEAASQQQIPPFSLRESSE
jgi:hypothetical protein